MKTKFFLLSIALAFAGTLFAETAKTSAATTVSLEFVERTHDFGEIKEVNGKIATTFEFTNTSKKAVTLTNVRASCGCTTPQWSKEPIAPGKKGYIKVTYNPAGRPGSFHKNITIRYNEAGVASAKAISCMIKGSVIPRPKTVTKASTKK